MMYFDVSSYFRSYQELATSGSLDIPMTDAARSFEGIYRLPYHEVRRLT